MLPGFSGISGVFLFSIIYEIAQFIGRKAILGEISRLLVVDALNSLRFCPSK